MFISCVFISTSRSPLAEGRELKYVLLHEDLRHVASPLAEGRELKSACAAEQTRKRASPLAEGRELKYPPNHAASASAPVAPRGGA